MATRPAGDTAPTPERRARYAWAAAISGGRVLDAGCGEGWGTARLAGSTEAAVGVDFSPAAVAEAQRRHGDAAEFREGDLRGLPFGEAEFDCVVCFEALTHVADPAQAIDELRRVLRPGGLLLASAPNRGVYPPGNPLQLSELSSEELRDLLAGRFAAVALHRQLSSFGSLLCDDGQLAGDAAARELDVTVTDAGGSAPGRELYAVAAASDGELPPAPRELVLGEQVDYEEQRRLLAEWQQRAVAAEAEAEALRRELGAAQG